MAALKTSGANLVRSYFLRLLIDMETHSPVLAEAYCTLLRPPKKESLNSELTLVQTATV